MSTTSPAVPSTTTPAPDPAAVPAPRRPGGVRVLLRTWAWGWLAAAQLVGDLLLAGPYLVIAGLLVGGVSSIAALGVGIPLTALALLMAFGVGSFERLRVQAFTGVVIEPPPGPAGPQTWWRRYLLDGRPWRATAHLTVIALWGLLVGTLTLVLLCVSLAFAALPLYSAALPDGSIALPWGARLAPHLGLFAAGVFGLVVLPLVARGAVGVDVHLAQSLLGRSRREQVQVLAERVETLQVSRAGTVDSVELERRRIERDLHDGPQQRLVAIAMDLGMAKEKLDSDPAGARELVEKAHVSAKEAITEMRQVARGIHPPILTDRGLDAALSALAARSPVPVTVRVEPGPRPGPTIEAIAYFCVSELLTNVAKHSRARTASVDVTRHGPTLVVRVTDDGVGGVDAARGTGLVGLRQRVAAVDGTIDVSSPDGGPTVVSVFLPEPRSTS
ncbi:sensor histidine kinase [Kineosporia sp. R_H_3]|uniref:sensor histidine kinase n=1 Tax=Kineosporia sp. R_H_3 TaxID=1961848 RepID=UPI00117A9546|nr:sensor histidine kinase [Kineosporia sp. R_H_3]